MSAQYRNSDRIVLGSFQPRIEVSRADTYFAFGDGSLDYDCRTCDAQCCRGHGFLIHKDELATTIALKPAVAWFSDLPIGPVGTTVQVRNCPPTCFFLDRNGQCDVQIQHGFAAKPETCRLFPFNDFRILGDQLIVSPHRTLCPLSVVPSGSASPLSEHARLWNAMAQRGINSRIRRVLPDGSDPKVRLDLERAILTASREHADAASYEQFVLT